MGGCGHHFAFMMWGHPAPVSDIGTAPGQTACWGLRATAADGPAWGLRGGGRGGGRAPCVAGLQEGGEAGRRSTARCHRRRRGWGVGRGAWGAGGHATPGVPPGRGTACDAAPRRVVSGSGAFFPEETSQSRVGPRGRCKANGSAQMWKRGAGKPRAGAGPNSIWCPQQASVSR